MLLDEPAVSAHAEERVRLLRRLDAFSAMARSAHSRRSKLEALSQEPGLGHLRRFPAVIDSG